MIRGSNIGIFLRSYPDLQTMNLVSGKKCAPLTQLTGHLSEADSFTGYDVNQKQTQDVLSESRADYIRLI